MKTVVIIGGGSATFNMLKGLRQFPTNNIVVVSTADSGGSTGQLRKELGVMPWGDIRQCLMGLSYTVPALCELFNHRFDKGSLKGHNVGNIILAALEKVGGSPEAAIAEAARLLNVRGEVLLVSKQPTTLSAELHDGSKIVGEHEIDEPITKKRSPIKRLTLSPAEANPRVLNAIGRADAIILGPGDLFTSTFPNLLVPGVAEAIAASPAKKILITNIMTKLGQTDGFNASHFLSVVNEYLASGKTAGSIDTVIVNTEAPSKAVLDRYRKEKAVFVKHDAEKIKREKVTVIAKPLVSKELVKKVKGDVLKRSFVRHDAEKTAAIIWELIK
ncbi:MAG: YvcK family protein [bacterium]|nr:YvcK family protein [bacterium]